MIEPADAAGLLDVRITTSTVLDDVVARAAVVVVDDSPANVTLLERLLHRAGVSNVRGFTEPGEAISHCASSSPDLVLVDLHMPRLDGIAVMEALADLRGPDRYLPVIVLTADVSVEVRNRVLAAGADDFLTKPLDRTEVILRVKHLLENRALHEALRRRNAELQHAVDEHDHETHRRQAERAHRERQLDSAIAPSARRLVFQSIADLTSGVVVGAEALSRFDVSPKWPPDRWFAEAAALDRETELELAVVADALPHLSELPSGAFLSLNVSPATAACADLPGLLGSVDSHRIVLEITEHSPVGDYTALLAALDRLRELGVSIAVDDTGAGFAGLQHLLRIRPEIIKLDTTLTRGIDADPARRALATGLITFAREIGATIVAEGIEIAGELATLRALGIPWGQGYYLATPGDLPLPDLRFAMLDDE